MATSPISGIAAPVTLPGTFPPMPAVARILAGFERDQLASFIEVAIGLLDVIEPDPDEPDFKPCSDGLPGEPADHEPAGDCKDTAWIEWYQLAGATKRAGGNGGLHIEDAEEDDEAEEDDPSGQCDEDEINIQGQGLQYRGEHGGPGCELSDPDQVSRVRACPIDQRDFEVANDH